MTKEEFSELQFRHQESGKSLKEYLRETGVVYSTYNYWLKKYLAAGGPHEFVSFVKTKHHSAEPLPFSKDLPSGATLPFPNGLRAHLGSGTEGMPMESLEKSLVSHVLP